MANTFIRDQDSNFVINGTTIPRSVFLALEPAYVEVENLSFLQYVTGGPRRVVANGKQYLIDGSWDAGERYISRCSDYVVAAALIESETIGTQEEIKKLVEDSKTPRGKRRKEYPPLEDLVIAMWENLIEKKTKKDSGIDQIQKLRKAIKAKYPEEGKEDASNTDEKETD
jgi:hypothetical protein